MSAFPDTGPLPSGRRSAEQWMNAMGEDVGIINRQLKETLSHPEEVDKVQNIAIALKEARRLQSDIYRFAKEVHGIEREELDSYGPL